MLNYSLGLGTTIQFNCATKEIREFLYRNCEGYYRLHKTRPYLLKIYPRFAEKFCLKLHYRKYEIWSQYGDSTLCRNVC